MLPQVIRTLVGSIRFPHIEYIIALLKMKYKVYFHAEYWCWLEHLLYVLKEVNGEGALTLTWSETNMMYS